MTLEETLKAFLELDDLVNKKNVTHTSEVYEDHMDTMSKLSPRMAKALLVTLTGLENACSLQHMPNCCWYCDIKNEIQKIMQGDGEIGS